MWYLIVSQNQSIKKIDFLSLYPTFMRVCEELIFLKLDAVFRIHFVHKYVTIKMLFILGGLLWITTKIKTKIKIRTKTHIQIKISTQIRIIHTAKCLKALFKIHDHKRLAAHIFNPMYSICKHRDAIRVGVF